MGLCCEKQDYASLPQQCESVPSPSPTGLFNLGNTCYINCVLQCLLHTRPLHEYFSHQHHLQDLNPTNPLGTGGLFALALGDLIVTRNAPSAFQSSAQRLVGVIWANSPFTSGLQGDVHEFLLFFLDKIHEDLNRSQGPPSTHETKAAKQCGSRLFHNSSVVVDLLQGQTRSIIHCLNCNLRKMRFEQFLTLSLPIVGHKTLEECLSGYLQTELLSTGNEWNCTRCKEKVPTHKKSDLWEVPPVLILHLNRFFCTKTGRGKLSEFVEYPVDSLDLSPFLSQGSALYELFGVIEHKGSLSGGHYISLAKDPFTTEWSRFDDSVVSPVRSFLPSKDSYVLFYQEVLGNKYSLEQVDMPHYCSDSFVTNK